jgi:predicted dehydrogenase
MARRIGIAGLGAAAREIHLPALAALDVEVVGGCDPAMPRDLPFPVHSSVERLLAESAPDILVVATPPDSHFELARAGLDHGCHVFCEKPFTDTLEQAKGLLKRSREVGRWVVVNNQFRFMNIHRKAKAVIGTPEFGELRFLNAQQTFRTTPETEAGWRGSELRRTCKDFGTHVLDLCRFFFDEDPVSIRARMPRGSDPDGPDYLNLVELDFSGDRVAQITLDRWCRGPNRYLDLRLVGTTGSVETHVGGGIVLSAGLRGGDRRAFCDLDIAMGGTARLYQGERFRRIATDPLDLFANATRELFRAFLAALESGGVPPCEADDNRRTLALMLSAYEAAQTGARVEMRY